MPSLHSNVHAAETYTQPWPIFYSFACTSVLAVIVITWAASTIFSLRSETAALGLRVIANHPQLSSKTFDLSASVPHRLLDPLVAPDSLRDHRIHRVLPCHPCRLRFIRLRRQHVAALQDGRRRGQHEAGCIARGKAQGGICSDPAVDVAQGWPGYE
jgi:hypothetical protein